MPSCPNHPDVALEAKKKGWYCEECESNVLSYEQHPREVAPVAPVATSPGPETSLPTVLALPLAELAHEPSPVLGLWAACDAVEVALKVCVMAGVAQHGQLPSGLLRELRDRVELPTLGKWLGMALAVAKHEAPDSVLPVAGMVRSLETLLGGREATVETGLLPLRNRLAHGGPVTKAEAARLHAAWEPKVRAWAEASLGPLREAVLAAVDSQGRRVVLRGVEGKEADASLPVPSDAAAGTAWLCVGEKALPLGPLAAFDSGMQLYVRRGEVRLQYLRMGEDGGLADSPPEAMESFKRLFLSAEDSAPSNSRRLVIRDFTPDIRKEASRRVGREREFAALTQAVRGLGSDGVLWLAGPAGIGKSNLVSAVMEALLDAPPPDTLVLPYRFRAGDDRCGRAPFLAFLRERLEGSEWLRPEEPAAEGETEKPTKPSTDAVQEVKQLLSRLREGVRVQLLLDGMDEAAERDARFVEDVLFRLRVPGVSIAAAGRPERGLPEAFARVGAVPPFPEGLPPMGEDDVRALLLERTGPVRKRLLARDREAGGAVHNAFIEKVTKRSEGLPLYVNYVAGDLNAGKVSPESPDALPDSLHAYHEELLRRASVGDLQAVTTPVLVLLALAHEPLTVGEVAALLKRRGVLLKTDEAIVERAVQAIASMVRRAPDPDGEEGYTVFHHSLRLHVQQSLDVRLTVEATHEALADAALKPHGDAAEVYLYRCGVRHLLEAGRTRDALGALTGFGYLMARFQRLDVAGRAADGWYADWVRVLQKTGPLTGLCRLWESFARERAHLLRRGTREWPSHRILLQLAMEHADDSPITKAAEVWLNTSDCHWLWWRRAGRPSGFVSNSCRQVFEGHRGPVNGAALLTSDRIASWSDDKTVRIWDLENGSCIATIEQHVNASGVAPLAGGHLATWSHADSKIYSWDGASGSLRFQFCGHSQPVVGCMCLPDGRLLSWSLDGTLRLWNSSTGDPIFTLAGHDQGVKGAIPLDEEKILSWGDDSTLRVWDISRGVSLAVLAGHEAAVRGAVIVDQRRVLSWSFDRTVRVWDWSSGILISTLKSPSGELSGVISTPTGQVVTWSRERLMYLWDRVALDGDPQGDSDGPRNSHGRTVREQGVLGEPGNSDGFLTRLEQMFYEAVPGAVRPARLPTNTMVGHAGEVEGARVLSNGDILSWSYDNTLRTWDGITGSSLTVMQGHAHRIAGALQLSDERVLSWSFDGALLVWDRSKDDPVGAFRGHTEAVFGVTELADGTCLSWSFDGTLRLWDLCTIGSQGKSAHYQTAAVVHGAEILADGRVVSWGGSTLQLWDIHRGIPVVTLAGHTDHVQGATLLPDGRLLSWSWDDTIRTWDGSSGKRLSRIPTTEARQKNKDLYQAWQLASVSGKIATGVRDKGVEGGPRIQIDNSARTIDWHADGLWRTAQVLPSGVALAHCNNQVVMLELFSGAKRISLSEARNFFRSQ